LIEVAFEDSCSGLKQQVRTARGPVRRLDPPQDQNPERFKEERSDLAARLDDLARDVGERLAE
jgi:hypothetical protein